MGCDPSRVLSFGVLGSVCMCVCFFFFLFCRDPCLKEEVGIAEIGGDWWVSWWRLVGLDWWVSWWVSGFGSVLCVELHR